MTANVRSMAYVGARPWHGFGERLKADDSIDLWKQQAGLDYEIAELPIFADLDHTMLRVPKKKALVRTDTHDVLSVVSTQFKIAGLQPGEIMEFYRDLVADMGFVMESAGALGAGQKVWALAKTGAVARIMNQDEVQQYLLLATAYDGSFATTGTYTAVRVVCQNTLHMALSEAENAVKIGHRSEFNPIEVKAKLGLSRESFAAWKQSAELLARVKIDASAAHQFYRDVFDIPTRNDLVPDKKMPLAVMADTFRDRFNNNTYTGADLEAANGTAWGLVNVVTEYLDHIRRETKNGGRLNNAWFGQGATLKQCTWDRAVELIDA